MAKPPSEPRPVQVFLDTKKFIEVPEPRQGGGGHRDFFKDNDAGFAEQKRRVRQTLKGMGASLRKRGDQAGFFRVQMREDALAKSYRPLVSLFTESHGFALVGAGRIGEMIFQGSPEALDELDHLIEQKAEATPRRVLNPETSEYELRVSGYRSEVGGIAELSLYDAADRVSFSAEEATAWFKDGNTLGGYVVELFRPRLGSNTRAVQSLVRSLEVALRNLPSGIAVRPFRPSEASSKFGDPPLALSIQLLRDGNQRRVELPFSNAGVPTLQRTSVPSRIGPNDIDLNQDHHAAFLRALGEQTLVRSVDLPPLIEAAPAATATKTSCPEISQPPKDARFPVVGIIDGGVANLKVLEPWRAGDAGIVPPAQRDETHGTFIAGLIAAGATLNPQLGGDVEPGGCKFFDLDMFPRKDLRQSYYGGDIDYFFDLLEEKIKAAKRDHGVRVFNFSFGLRPHDRRYGYSPIADRLDRIARSNDIIFIVSAGNLPTGSTRPPWSENPVEAVTMLAAFGASQHIVPPAENLLGLTVGAVNPPGVRGHIPGLPTTYTRRGPGVGGARKPDLSHIGGAEPGAASGNRTGLMSLSTNGDCVESCGTSFAAPSVAATLATLDRRLEQEQPRELLLAMPIHRAARAAALGHSALRHVAREFVGFGQPMTADQMLLDDPYGITLVFSETLHAKQELQFPFSWPAGLTLDGSCSGQIELTLAYTPPIDADHKDEAQRVELEAHIHQESIDPETGEATWASRLNQDGAGVPQGTNKTERYLLSTGLKWTPNKRYSAAMPRGRGNSSNWRLSLTSLTRAGATFPDEGVRFALIMTISDPKQKAAIHDSVRNNLLNQGLQIADIMVAHRVRQRG